MTLTGKTGYMLSGEAKQKQIYLFHSLTFIKIENTVPVYVARYGKVFAGSEWQMKKKTLQ